MKHKRGTRLKKRWSLNWRLVLPGVLFLSVLGIVAVLTSHASITPIAFEPESGMLTSPAKTVTPSGASGGIALQFGSPTPTSNSAPSGFISVCGTKFCSGSTIFYPYFGSVYGGINNPAATVQEAVVARLNTIRITDFIDTSAGITGSTDQAHWQKVDALIATAGSSHLKVVLDLSTFRNMLKTSNINPYTYNWQTFLQFVTTRVNTVSGRTYSSDPAIAMIALAGEVDPPNGSGNTLGVTQQQVTDFYTRTLAQLSSLDTNHIRTSGGFLQLDWNSGIDWHTIFAGANDQVCDIHDYSQSDQNITPTIASYCAGLGKPWMTEEFGFNQTDGDSKRSSEFTSMFNLQTTNHAAAVGFWNLGTEVIGTNGKTDTFDVNPNTPQTLAAVQQNTP